MNESNTRQIINVNILDLLPSPHQPRLDDTVGIEQLMENIKTFGILNPPSVIRHSGKKDKELAGKYFIVAGHRRIRAAKALGFTTIEVSLSENDDPRVPLVDNMFRENLILLEIGIFVKRALTDSVFNDNEDICNCTGFDMQKVEFILKLGELNENIQNHLLKNRDKKFSTSNDILNRLVRLSELVLDHNQVITLIKEMATEEASLGFQRKVFLEWINEDILTEEKRIKLEESEQENQKEEEAAPVEYEEEPNSLLDEDFDVDQDLLGSEDMNFNTEVVEDEDSIEENMNIIDEPGVKIKHSDDFRQFDITIDVTKTSAMSADKAISTLQKVIKMLS